MEHIGSILWLLSWPLLIYASYKLSILALGWFDKSRADRD